ncbi:LysR family transcriptional regulator [Actinoplanes cyaneus]|uniref:LysR family transcriptional regulator n=1 Tax=Actinoplanes cyaneus TaxID=52696 RepID=A0A919IPJ7_9ACTN|nr:LysR family transcriptional regulator [Actinoplanes cyaneus]MCW2143962.1 ModE molybdate transport repressor domain-containing protein [Actinoplanes cyaneus]GID69779.1 LysR family transcriptional regulator [Actinoplanes cyaneus]
MDLREFRVFLAIAERGSLSGAARRLRVSQPAVSQTVAALEQQVGVELLERSSTGVRLTEAGVVLAGEARAVLARYEQALSAVGRFALSADTRLRVGVPLELPPGLLPSAFAALAGSHPRTRTEVRHLTSAAQLDALRDGDLELGLLRSHPMDSDFDAMLVVEEPLGVLLSASDQRSDSAGVRLEKLAGLDWLAFARADSPPWFDEVNAVLRSHGVDPGPAVPPGQFLIAEVKFAAVSSGQAFAFAPRDWSQPLPAGVLWTPLVGSPLIRRTWATWPADSRRRDLAALIAHLDPLDPPAA